MIRLWPFGGKKSEAGNEGLAVTSPPVEATATSPPFQTTAPKREDADIYGVKPLAAEQTMGTPSMPPSPAENAISSEVAQPQVGQPTSPAPDSLTASQARIGKLTDTLANQKSQTPGKVYNAPPNPPEREMDNDELSRAVNAIGNAGEPVVIPTSRIEEAPTTFPPISSPVLKPVENPPPTSVAPPVPKSSAQPVSGIPGQESAPTAAPDLTPSPVGTIAPDLATPGSNPASPVQSGTQDKAV